MGARFLALCTFMCFLGLVACTADADRTAPENMNEFIYSAISEAHLGGDDFRKKSVRIDPGMGRAELAEVTASGRLISLTYAAVGAGELPVLPRPPAPTAGNTGGPPPLETEGMGAVSVAAIGKGWRGTEVRRIENPDPRSTDPISAWADFDANLRGKVGPRTGSGKRGTYAQLSPLGRGVRAGGAVAVVETALSKNALYGALFAAPYHFVPVKNYSKSDVVAVLASVRLGRPQVLSLRGQYFVLSRFVLN